MLNIMAICTIIKIEILLQFMYKYLQFYLLEDSVKGLKNLLILLNIVQ